MHNDPTEKQDSESLRNSASRIESSLADINTRIARLSRLLNASLETEEDIVKILKRDNPFLQPHATDTLTQSEHRIVHEWEELRGLLVLRCDLMTHSFKDIGFDATLKMTVHVEERLVRDGFEPGAEGFDTLRDLTA